MTEKLAIIGIGNQEMGDDGIGIYLVERLQNELETGSWSAPSGMELELVSAGTDPILAGACILESSRALLIDAAEMNTAPGEFRFFSPEEVRFTNRGSTGKPLPPRRLSQSGGKTVPEPGPLPAPQPRTSRSLLPPQSTQAEALWTDSTHALSLGQVLDMVGELCSAARITIMGIQPTGWKAGSGLSLQVLARVPEMLFRMKEEVSLLP